MNTPQLWFVIVIHSSIVPFVHFCANPIYPASWLRWSLLANYLIILMNVHNTKCQIFLLLHWSNICLPNNLRVTN